MKAITKTLTFLPMTALFVLTTFADPTVKEKEFRGSIQSLEITEFDSETMTLSVEGSGAGHATQLGLFTYTYHAVGEPGTACGGGAAEFTAANGDSLVTELTG